MSEPITIVLPLPSRDVSPNGRGHWAKKARAVKKHREWAVLAVLSDDTPLPLWRTAEAQATFYVRDKRRRDGDNYLAMLKPYFDGIVQAGVLKDDSGVRHAPVLFVVDKKDPRVEIRIRPL